MHHMKLAYWEDTNAKIISFHFLSIYHCGKFRIPLSQGWRSKTSNKINGCALRRSLEPISCPALLAKSLFPHTHTETKSSPRLISIVRIEARIRPVLVSQPQYADVRWLRERKQERRRRCRRAALSDGFHSSLRRRLACQ